MATLLFVGDSHTEGLLGASWVALLQSQLAGARLVNAGFGGLTAGSIASRLPRVLLQHPSPPALVVLGGTNDVLAACVSNWATFYRYVMRQSAALTADDYTSRMRSILDQVAAAAPACRTFVVTIPPIGDDVTSAVNETVRRYNAALRQLVAAHPARATLVDFYEDCHGALQQRRQPPAAAAPPTTSRPRRGRALPQEAATEGAAAAGSIDGTTTTRSDNAAALPVVYEAVTAFLMHYILRRSWDAISNGRGHVLTVDGIHLNDTAARLLAARLRPLLQAAVDAASATR